MMQTQGLRRAWSFIYCRHNSQDADCDPCLAADPDHRPPPNCIPGGRGETEPGSLTRDHVHILVFKIRPWGWMDQDSGIRANRHRGGDDQGAYGRGVLSWIGVNQNGDPGASQEVVFCNMGPISIAARQSALGQGLSHPLTNLRWVRYHNIGRKPVSVRGRGESWPSRKQQLYWKSEPDFR